MKLATRDKREESDSGSDLLKLARGGVVLLLGCSFSHSLSSTSWSSSSSECAKWGTNSNFFAMLRQFS